MLAINMIEMAKKDSENSGGFPKTEFLKLKDGETKVFRLISGFIPTYVVSHSCGVSHIDISKDEFDIAMQGGKPFLCPQCGQPISADDIEFERPLTEGVYLHEWVNSRVEADKKGSYACIGHPANAASHIVPSTEMGEPLYACPICRERDEKGAPKYRTKIKLFGIAVEREVSFEWQMVNGINMQVAGEPKDVMVKGDDGIERPKLLIVNLPWDSFWSKVHEATNDYVISPCYFDWKVSRTGTGLNTKYAVSKVNDIPYGIDQSPYKDILPNNRRMIESWGKPEYYVKNGYLIDGYIPEDAESASQGTASAASMMAAAAAPQQHQQPVGTASWSQVSQAINQ